MTDGVSKERADYLRLRARIVALERTMLAALDITLRMRPEALEQIMESQRKLLGASYLDDAFAPDLTDQNERVIVAEEVERLMRAMQGEMNFIGGIHADETG